MDKERENQFLNMYMNIAYEIAKMSRAIRSKVGCVIVKDDRILSYGWNGMPSGFDNDCEYEHQKQLFTKKEVLHAESNAIAKIAKCNESSLDSTLFTVFSPCLQCAKLIIQSGIKKVVYAQEYRETDGLKLLEQAKIEIIYLKRL